MRVTTPRSRPWLALAGLLLGLAPGGSVLPVGSVSPGGSVLPGGSLLPGGSVAEARTTPRAVPSRPPAPSARRPSAEFLARLSTITDLEISPDGTRVAYTATDSLEPSLAQIWLVPTDGSAPPRPFAAVGHAAHAPRWSPDGTRLLFRAAGVDTGAEQLRLIAADGGESRVLTAEPRGVLEARWAPDGARVAYLAPGPESSADPWQGGRAPAGVRLKVLDLASGAVSVLSPDSASAWNMAWSPDGRTLAVLASPPGGFGEWRRGYLAFVDADGARWRRVAGRADPTEGVAYCAPPSDARPTPTVAYYALPARDYAYGVLSKADPQGALPLGSLEDTRLPSSSSGLGSAGDGVYVTTHRGVRSFISRTTRGARVDLAETWGGRFSVSRDGVLAYTTDAVDATTELYVLDPRVGPAPRRLTQLNPQLAGFPFAPPEVVTWSSFDGRRIEGLLFRPPGAEPGRRLPLVVMPHGGPSALWSLGFYADPHAPALYLAARGFACLLPNPRGSLGYGEAFNALNRGDLGGGDLKDIEAGVDSLVDTRVVDARRVGLCGISYGAYLAALAASKSARYRALVVADGPMDLFGNYDQDELGPWWEREFLGGPPYENRQLYFDRSPLYHVARIRAPTLILHGAEDRRVLPNQSQALYRALKERGVPTELHLYPREGHGVREPAHQVDVMRRTLEWLARHLDVPSALDPR